MSYLQPRPFSQTPALQAIAQGTSLLGCPVYLACGSSCPQGSNHTGPGLTSQTSSPHQPPLIPPQAHTHLTDLASSHSSVRNSLFSVSSLTPSPPSSPLTSQFLNETYPGHSIQYCNLYPDPTLLIPDPPQIFFPCFLTHDVIYLCLLSISLLEWKFHKGWDLCLFCSLIKAKHLAVPGK